MNEVEIFFQEKAIKRGGVVLYSKQDTLDFIKKCKDCDIGILGIDGFYIKETNIQPSLDNSIDYSADLSNNSIYDYDNALEFVSKRDDNLFFEIVCD
ncbi:MULTISPECIES: hypothetical protein [unclassified Chitinophaga]|uniref:hypothetical protein n=1 Tax=unclassified Chitinophaga TaxID=2619133 RepID=UPI0009CCAA9B|nr:MULTISPECIES: hypothetical protein [unclassified Chitinophaga]OMP76220.1 hypothetical protein BW716_25920 [[Flexibacter] sp. ATCC 35208]WPV64849.1 hypothetical protein QQL36_23890 [Chitinophaga sp. LS1]